MSNCYRDSDADYPLSKKLILITLFLTLIIIAHAQAEPGVGDFYYPPGNVPPGPPPNYNQIDSIYFAGTPSLPIPPPDSGGIYIWVDSLGNWHIANHIYSLGNSLEQFHGSILARLEIPPTLGENVFITDFEIFDDTVANRCYLQNDRWGWYQWDDNLYEIWWDVSTREWKKETGDLNDLMEIRIVGCAIDFNIWSSGHDGSFNADEIYLGSTKISLSDIPEYEDTYVGIQDPYQDQAGSNPSEDPNITIFTPLEGEGVSYNRYGEIVPGQAYPCGDVLGVNYGDRFTGTFVYEGNGIQFSSVCDGLQGPGLEVDGDIIDPMGDDSTDILIEICGGRQIWSLIKEYTPWENVNRFGFYSDPGEGNSQELIFSGPDSAVKITTTFTSNGFLAGLWLLNDVNGDSIYNGEDSYLFSERALTQGSGANNHQWFKVYDVSAYKGTGVDYRFFCPTQDHSFTGDYDYLIFIDDDHSSANFDHNDMMVGILCEPNSAPVVSCPIDTSIFLCELGEICLPGFNCYDVDGNLSSCDVSLGILNGDTLCFTPTTAGIYEVTYIAIDSLGLSDTCVVEIEVVINSSPTAVSPDDFSAFVCDLNNICVPGFLYSDPDNNIQSVDIIGGTINGDTICFTPQEGLNTITLIVTDECGESDTATTNITVELNSPPVVSGPADTSIFVCSLDQICLDGFGATDPDNNIASIYAVNGTYSAGSICFNPVEGANILKLIAVDNCGASDTVLVGVNVDLNLPPAANSPEDYSLFVCDLTDICLPGFTYSDPDNNISSVNVNGGTLSGDSVCFTPVEGLNTITMIVTDACGYADTAVTNVTIGLNSAPTASAPSDTSMFVCDLLDICLPEFTYSDTDNNIASVDVTGGTLSGDTVCFTPVAGVNIITMIVTDDCGESDTTVTNVTVTLNASPTASSPNDTTIFVCDDSDICVAGFTYSDPDNNIVSVDIIGGILSGDTVCFTPVMGANTITLIVADACGEADTVTTVITVAINNPPSVSAPSDTSMFVCDLSEICLTGFTYSDPDNNISSVNVIGGTLSGDTVCFTPVEGLNTITMIVTDACGFADTAVTNVTIGLNSAPTASAPSDTSMFVCDLLDICLPEFTYSDTDNNIASVDVTGGTLSGDTVCFTPVAGVNIITMIVTDDCGESDTTVTNVTVTLNASPTASSPNDTTIFVCDDSDICVAGFTYSDPDNNIVSVDIIGGILSGDTVCFTPVTGANTITLIVADACGEADTVTTVITVAINNPPSVSAPSDTSMFVCDLSEICLTGFTYSDPDNNISSVNVIGGTLSGDTVCFTPVVGDNEIIIRVYDLCGELKLDTVVVSIALNSPPSVSCPDDTSADFTCGTAEICVGPFSHFDSDNNIDSVYVVLSGAAGSLDGDLYCFTPLTGGVYSLMYIAVDSCGAADTCSMNINITVDNSAPVVNCPGDTAITVCALDPMCIDGFAYSDVDNNIANIQIGGGTFDNGSICFTPIAGENILTVTVTDSCGLISSCTTAVSISINTPPSVTCFNDTTILLSNYDEICLTGLVIEDPDTNVVDISVINGILVGDTVCFTPVAGVNTITVIATDSCGEIDSCTANVIVGLCDYTPGDTDHDGEINGLDLTYMANYFKMIGPAPVDTCDCRPDVTEYPFYGAGDTNGDCTFNGIDVTYTTLYFKQIVSHLMFCQSCPPTGGWIAVSSLKNVIGQNTETEFRKNISVKEGLNSK